MENLWNRCAGLFGEEPSEKRDGQAFFLVHPEQTTLLHCEPPGTSAHQALHAHSQSSSAQKHAQTVANPLQGFVAVQPAQRDLLPLRELRVGLRIQENRPTGQ